jgi:hypothetical protein
VDEVRTRPESGRTYRSASTPWIAALVVFMGMMIIIGAAGGIASPHHGDSAIRFVGIIVTVVGILVIVWAVMIVGRMGVTTDNQGISIQNWLRRRFLGWGQITEFSFGSDLDNLSLREMLSSPMLSTYVVISDGRHLGLSGISATRLDRTKSRAKVQELLDDLEAQRLRFQR